MSEPTDMAASHESKPARSECSDQKKTLSGSSSFSPSLFTSRLSKDLEKPAASE